MTLLKGSRNFVVVGTISVVLLFVIVFGTSPYLPYRTSNPDIESLTPAITHDDTSKSPINSPDTSIIPHHGADFINAPPTLGGNGRPRLPLGDLRNLPNLRISDDGSHLSARTVEKYTNSILDLGDTAFWRQECHNQDNPGVRYKVLKHEGDKANGIKYFFALNLYECIHILPRLLGTVIQTVKILGVENCAISIVEGRSTDGTYLVLQELREHLAKLNIKYFLMKAENNPHEDGKDRIAELSVLRNMVLLPLLDSSSRAYFADEPQIVFINDIAVCTDDVLELIYQHLLQGATQTCSMDYVEGGNLFYDSWVSRSMSGNIFFEIPQDMSFAFSRNMFWDERISKRKWELRQPLQVFSCWGGMTVMEGAPFVRKDVEFRRNYKGECYGGEPQTLGSDWAKLGISKVQVVRNVAVAYSDHEGAETKRIHGYVKEHVDMAHPIEQFSDDLDTTMIRWRPPPPRYRCMPGFTDQWWVPSVWDPETVDDF